MAFRSRRPRVTGSRRMTDWAATSGRSAYTALAAASSILDTTFVTLDSQPETIVRTVGLLNIQSDQAAASERPFGAVGICIVSDQAAAIGITAIPKPFTDASSDLWFMHRFWAAPVAEAGTGASLQNISQDVDLSSKAMRKLTDDETVCLVIENASAIHGAEYTFNVRLLSKVA